MLYTEMTKKALQLCFDAHRDQKDKSGLPYVFHPFHLAEQMQTEETTVVALLHDVVEDTDYTLADLAAMSNMCVSNLEKLFKKNFGLSPGAYRNKLRIEHAKKLLSGGYSISDAAQLTGFSDYFYFSRIFKQFAGCSPGTFKDEDTGI